MHSDNDAPQKEEPKEVNRTRTKTKIRCATCHRWQRRANYRQLTPVPGKPRPRSDNCLSCEAISQAQALKSDVVGRLTDKQKKEIREKTDFVEKIEENLELRNRVAERKAPRGRISAQQRKEKARIIEEQAKLELVIDTKARLDAEPPKLSAVEKEIASRALCRRKLLPFIKKFNKRYSAGWVHRDICRRLEQFVKDVEDQKGPRLMLFMPPRHGKSEIASKNLPAWVLGNHPDWEIIASSYAVSLPIGFSRKVQGIIQDSYYQKLFPQTRLNPKAMAADAWMTDGHEGGYIAAGVGTGISGKGAHILIIDDPVKDAEEADSTPQRDKVWDWWGSTAKTRLAPGGGVLVIQTRWHDDDLSGRMLAQKKELEKEFGELILKDPENEELYRAQMLEELDMWEVVEYPAIATHDEYLNTQTGELFYDEHDGDSATVQVRMKGNALHPERFPVGRLMNMKRTLQPRHWSALYQQNPVPDEGIYFTRDMIRYTPMGSVPQQSDMKLYSAWDLAVGEKQSNDYTVGVVGGLDWMDRVHILEIIRFRGDIHTVAETIMSTYKKYPSLQEIGVEKGQLELALKPQLKKLMKKEKLYPVFNEELRPIQDKWMRARPLQGRMQQGMVVFPHGQEWVEVAVSELLRFPGGLHDDIVDGLAWLIRMMHGVQAPKKPGEKKTETWRQKLNRIHAQQGRGTPIKGYMGA
jgi:predicted phage terminase large subunit-like protein